MRNYEFPVYSTNAGGIACSIYGGMRFIEAPNFSEFIIGDVVPEDWELSPANFLAKCEVADSTPEAVLLEHELERTEHAMAHGVAITK